MSDETKGGRRSLVLLSKQYPYGHAETYLNNEIPILDNAFQKVFLVPVDAYRFEVINPLVEKMRNVQVIPINSLPAKSTLFEKLTSTCVCIGVILGEVFRGREGATHLRRFGFCLTYLKVAFDQARKLDSAISASGVDKDHILLYSYWLHKGTIAGIFYRKYFNRKAKLISRAHSSDLYHRDWNDIIQMKDAPFAPFENFKVCHCDHIYAISQHGTDHLKEVFPDMQEKFSVERLAVRDTGAINPFERKDFFRIVTCSGITPNKRTYHLPEILYHLRDLDVEWVHMGEGKGQNMDFLQSEIDKYKVADRVNIKGRMDNSDIFHYYQEEQVNVILNLSKAEGIPVSLMEAISFGVPGIVTNTVGNPEVIDETCGFQVPVDFKPEAVAQLIRKMFIDHELQVKLRKGARMMFEKKYNAFSNYTQFVKKLKDQFPA